ncbi:MAG: hypothetical protein SCH71_02220 [Desulfobulbaceae bacterium]|nr:hypothetical protein [Desulfobulbaceae bacterium]
MSATADKENEPKERAPVTFGPVDFFAFMLFRVFMPLRVLLKAAGILKTRGVYAPIRGTQTVQNPFSAAFAVLTNVNGKDHKTVPSRGNYGRVQWPRKFTFASKELSLYCLIFSKGIDIIVIIYMMVSRFVPGFL